MAVQPEQLSNPSGYLGEHEGFPEFGYIPPTEDFRDAAGAVAEALRDAVKQGLEGLHLRRMHPSQRVPKGLEPYL